VPCTEEACERCLLLRADCWLGADMGGEEEDDEDEEEDEEEDEPPPLPDLALRLGVLSLLLCCCCCC